MAKDSASRQKRKEWFSFVDENPRPTLSQMYTHPFPSNTIQKLYDGKIYWALYSAITKDRDPRYVSADKFSSLVYHMVAGKSRLLSKAGLSHSLEDMMQDGYIGLMDGLSRVKPNFSQRQVALYLYKSIQSGILDGLSDTLLSISLPLVAMENFRHLRKMITLYDDTDSREVFQRTGQERISAPVLRQVINLLKGKVNLREDLKLYPEPNIDEELYPVLISLIEKNLTQEEQEIILSRFFKGETLEEIGERFGFTKQYICCIESKALEKLKRECQRRARYQKTPLMYFNEWIDQ